MWAILSLSQLVSYAVEVWKESYVTDKGMSMAVFHLVKKNEIVSHSVGSDSLWPHGL